MPTINWKTRDDGVLYFEPVGFADSYYIYPPKYDDEDQTTYTLSQIDAIGVVVKEYQSTNMEKLKNVVVKHFNHIIEDFIRS